MNLGAFPTQRKLGFSPIQTIEENTSLAEALAGDIPAFQTRSLRWQLDIFAELEFLAGFDYIEYGEGTDAFEIFDVGADVATVGVWRVNAFGGEVIEAFEMRVHDDFLLVGVFERFGARQGLVGAGDHGGATLEDGNGEWKGRMALNPPAIAQYHHARDSSQPFPRHHPRYAP